MTTKNLLVPPARLFKHGGEPFTEVGCQLDDEIREAFKPIISKYYDEGYSIRDIELIAIHSIQADCSQLALETQCNFRKAKEKSEGI